jgi:hypothetical protein
VFRETQSGSLSKRGSRHKLKNNDPGCHLIGFRFNQNGKWIGSTKTQIHIIPGPGDSEFTGVAKVSTPDLQDNEVGTSEVRLEEKRIQVEPF